MNSSFSRSASWLHSWAGRVLAAVFALSLLTPVAEAKRYGSGGGKSFSSGSRSSGSKSGGYSSGRSSYSSGSSKSSSSSTGSSSRSSSGYDAAAARAKQQADSRNRYHGSKTPPPLPSGSAGSSGGTRSGTTTYRSGSGSPWPIPSGRGYASSGRSYSNSGGGSWNNSRPWRSGSGMSTGAKAAIVGAAVLAPALMVYASRPVAHYQDPYGSPFWWWLLEQPQEVRASWLHHHQGNIDPARRDELLRADPALQAKVDDLAARKVAVEPDYAPAGLKADDMYVDPAADAEAEAAVRQEEEAEAQALSTSRSGSGGGGGSGFFWLTTLAAGGALLWLIFFKRWQPARAA